MSHSAHVSDLPFEVEEDSDPSSQTLASRVLIVDDEAVVLDVMFRLLSREQDLVLSTFSSGEDALERMREERFDVLITDKNLPGMGGVELIAQAKRLRPQLEAIMITGYASAESVIAAFASGASDYLVKPFEDLRTVRAKIRAALDRRQERSRVRAISQSLAREAKQLLDQGKDAPEDDWQRLEAAFRRYEETIRAGASGDVALVGSDRARQLLTSAEISARLIAASDPSLAEADVVVLETAEPSWRSVADRLVERAADVILLAAPTADLADLLEAIALRLELIGYGGVNATALGERVKALLMRRAVQRAQADLMSAITAFRGALAGA